MSMLPPSVRPRRLAIGLAAFAALAATLLGILYVTTPEGSAHTIDAPARPPTVVPAAPAPGATFHASANLVDQAELEPAARALAAYER